MSIEIIPDIGINHYGKFMRALEMIQACFNAGAQVVKFQCHIPEEEMIPNNVIPSNANETIWAMMQRCSFQEREEIMLSHYCADLGMEYLSTPFSLAAVDRLERIGVTRYKIGSGECNNYPLIQHVVDTGKKIILSTGMNDYSTIDRAVELIGGQLDALLHCVSMYPTPYDQVSLRTMTELQERYGCRIGLSDHSLGIYTSLAAVALGATVVEKHFTSNKTWKGPDIPISIDENELRELIEGANAIQEAMQGGGKTITDGERLTAMFAYASVVSTRDINAGELLTSNNVTVKRPGGGIPAAKLYTVIGRHAIMDIPANRQIKYMDLEEL